MSFLDTALGTALGGVGGGILANNWDKLTQGPNVLGYQPGQPITAQNTMIDPSLTGLASPYGTNAYNTINANYGAAKSRLANDASARGMNGAAAVGPNSYAGQRLAATQGLDVGNLESALGGGLGNTAYKNTLANREYNQDTQLAEEAARLNKPDLLQQILGGIGNVGGTAAMTYGAFGRNRQPSYSPDSYLGGV